jgi:hypothetical protein
VVKNAFSPFVFIRIRGLLCKVLSLSRARVVAPPRVRCSVPPSAPTAARPELQEELRMDRKDHLADALAAPALIRGFCALIRGRCSYSG